MLKYKALLAALLLATGLANAQQLSFSSVSKCTQSCMADIAKSVKCDPTDLTCQCGSRSWRKPVLECTEARCGVIDVVVFLNTDAQACHRPENSLGPSMRAQVIASAVLAYIFLALRVVSRWGNFWWDDWLHVASMLVYNGQIVGQLLSIKTGLGGHLWLPQALLEFEQPLKYAYIWAIFYLLSSTLVKVSILCLYLRLFPVKSLQWMAKGVIALTVIANTILLFIIIFSCRPIEAFWKQVTITNGKCMSLTGIAYAQTGFNLAIEILIIILPLQPILTLHLAWRKKIGVAGIFVVGIITIAIAIYRIPQQARLQDFGDVSYNYAKLIPIAGWELCASYFCAAAPALRSLVIIYKERNLTKFTSFSTKKSSSGGKSDFKSSSGGRSNAEKEVVKPFTQTSTVDSAVLGYGQEDTADRWSQASQQELNVPVPMRARISQLETDYYQYDRTPSESA